MADSKHPHHLRRTKMFRPVSVSKLLNQMIYNSHSSSLFEAKLEDVPGVARIKFPLVIMVFSIVGSKGDVTHGNAFVTS